MKSFFKIVLGTLVGTLLALTLAFFIMLGIVGSMASFSETKPVVPKSAVLSLDFNTAITEQSTEDPFASINPMQSGSSKTQGLLQFVQTIDKAAKDPAIKFIYMNLTNLNGGVTHIEEIKTAIERFRLSGKAVIAYADNFSQPAYYLATSADKIYLSPTGMLPLTGVSVSSVFFKDLLDKLGIEVQLIRHGKFKAAAEQFISNKMSPENRQQLQDYVDAVWESWVEEIAKTREITPEEINLMTDNLSISTAQDALDAGLIDGLMYKDNMVDTLVKLFGVEKEKELKIISSTAYHKATYKIDFKEKNKIAIIYANGEIVMGKSENNIASDSFIEHVSKVRKDSTIKAVVFRVNSPGGSAQSSDVIERELQLLMEEKPVVVSMGDYAASGGYWISAKANKIFTNNTTLTGSIGVFSIVPNFQKTMNKHLSLNAESVNSNQYSDIMSGFRPLATQEIEFVRSAIEEIYTNFITLVSEGRGMTPEEVDEIAQGRVWAGSDALIVGLADERGGILDAIASAATFGNLDSYRIVEYPVQKNAVERFLEMLTETSVAAKTISNPYTMLENTYQKLREERGISHFTRLPYNIYFN